MSCRETVKMGRKGSELSSHNSGRFLRSTSAKKNKAYSEPLNDSAAAQSAVKKRKNDSPLGSPNNSARVLRSATKNKDEEFSKPLNNWTAGEPASNKRKGISRSKVGHPINSARVLRSASKYDDETCTQPLNGSAVGEPAKDRRKHDSPSKLGSPSSSARVLRSASQNNNEACSELLNENTVAQPAMKRRKTGSASKVRSPVTVSGARVLRSTSERKNVTCTELLNVITSSQPAVRKAKHVTPSKTDSSKVGVRVLRSTSGKKNEACSSEPLNGSTSAQPAMRKRKSDRPKDHSPKKDYLKVSQRVRYILNRMNYEQSLIQAYASEGWKGQSLEKIRPEKELERAKAEILRCKFRIREAFRNMDSLLSKGKLEESLFDSAGEISSEDIFCAICASKDVTLQNDILLCDGACDRGFHQDCLNPPLLTEDIPPGDEGWFCPACVCKADCIDALNELQGSKLSIHDSWEKVFPEAASHGKGFKLADTSDLPPDHAEGDKENNLALAEGHMVNQGIFSAEDDYKVDDLGLPSEDSEDDDFDPAGPDSSEDQKNKSNSDESDFTSDSDDFCAVIAKSCGQDEVLGAPLSNVINHTDRMKIKAVDNHSNEENSNRAFIEMELEQDMVLPVSGRRQVERLNYKKLYDEAYGKESSDSSDDEEWSGKELLKGSETDSFGDQLRPAKRCSRRTAVHQNNERTQRKQLHGSEGEQQTEVLCSNGSGSTVRTYHFGPIVSQKLKVHFEKDPYPSRTTKGSLAQELGLTFNQVCKWFSSTRHYSRVASAKKDKHLGSHATENNGTATVDSLQAREPNAGVMEKLTADRNDLIPEKPMAQNNQCYTEDIPPSGTEIEMDSYGQESSDSSDEEWSANSKPRKGRVHDNIKGSLSESLYPAKRCSRRAPAREQNNEHIPQSEQLHGSASEQQTEVLSSNGNSSKTPGYHFGPIVIQKLRVHFEKDPYPSHTTKENLAQELGLTFNQVTKWFSATRHYSRVAAAKNTMHPRENTTENNVRTTVESIQVIDPNVGLMEKPSAARDDVISKQMMFQINLNEGNEEEYGDIPHNPYTKCDMTPTTISREVGPPGYGPGENFLQADGGSRNTSREQSMVMTPTTISREVGPPGYGPGESQAKNQGTGASWNSGYEQGVYLIPTTTTISREVGPPGYGPGENQVGTSWNISCEQGMFTSPMTISREDSSLTNGPRENQGNGTSWNPSLEQRISSHTNISKEASPPGYGTQGNQGNDASWDTRCEQGGFMSPMTISRDIGPPGYGPGENQGNWNMNCEQRMFTSPMSISREVGPQGYVPVENQGNGGSRDINLEQTVFMTPVVSREIFPPGYGPGENQGNGASGSVKSPQGRAPEKVELSDEARKKAIQRELRRRQKFR